MHAVFTNYFILSHAYYVDETYYPDETSETRTKCLSLFNYMLLYILVLSGDHHLGKTLPIKPIFKLRTFNLKMNSAYKY